MSRARSALISYLYNDQLGNRNLNETQSLYDELKSKPDTSTKRADVSLSVIKWSYLSLSFFFFQERPQLQSVCHPGPSTAGFSAQLICGAASGRRSYSPS